MTGRTKPTPGLQGYTVPKGVTHKTSSPGRTVNVMVESAGVVPTRD